MTLVRLPSRRWIAFSFSILAATTKLYAQMPVIDPMFDQEPLYQDALLNRTRYYTPAFLMGIESELKKAQQEPVTSTAILADLTYFCAAYLISNDPVEFHSPKQSYGKYCLSTALRRVRREYGSISPQMAYVHLKTGNLRKAEYIARRLYGQGSVEHFRMLGLMGAMRPADNRNLEIALVGLLDQLPDGHLEIAKLRFHLGIRLIGTDVERGKQMLTRATEAFVANEAGWLRYNLYAHVLLSAYYSERGDEQKAMFHLNQLGQHAPLEETTPAVLIWLPGSPEEERRYRDSGTVTVSYTIDPRGRTSNIRVVETSNEAALVEQAIMHVARYLYRPAYRDGIAVESEEIETTLRFPKSFPIPPLN